MPPDPTNLEDNIHAAMFSGQFEETLHSSSQLDLWLSAHLSEFMGATGLLQAKEE